MVHFNAKKVTKTNIELSPEEAFAAISIVAMNIDGVNHKAEFQVIGMTLDRMKMFKDYTVASLKDMLQKLQKLLSENDIHVLLKAALAKIPSDLIATAYAVAIEIIMADGKVVEKEKNLLEELARSLNIPIPLTNKIIEVMQIRYKG